MWHVIMTTFDKSQQNLQLQNEKHSAKTQFKSELPFASCTVTNPVRRVTPRGKNTYCSSTLSTGRCLLVSWVTKFNTKCTLNRAHKVPHTLYAACSAYLLNSKPASNSLSSAKRVCDLPLMYIFFPFHLFFFC